MLYYLKTTLHCAVCSDSIIYGQDWSGGFQALDFFLMELTGRLTQIATIARKLVFKTEQ